MIILYQSRAHQYRSCPQLNKLAQIRLLLSMQAILVHLPSMCVILPASKQMCHPVGALLGGCWPAMLLFSSTPYRDTASVLLSELMPGN